MKTLLIAVDVSLTTTAQAQVDYAANALRIVERARDTVFLNLNGPVVTAKGRG
jgi:hypothetical protein